MVQFGNGGTFVPPAFNHGRPSIENLDNKSQSVGLPNLIDKRTAPITLFHRRALPTFSVGRNIPPKSLGLSPGKLMAGPGATLTINLKLREKFQGRRSVSLPNYTPKKKKKKKVSATPSPIEIEAKTISKEVIPCPACIALLDHVPSESDLDSVGVLIGEWSDRDDESDYRDELVIEQPDFEDEDDPLGDQRLSNMSDRDSSKALYYTLASSTVLEKTSYCPSSRELDNVFLAAAKYGDLDILLRSLDNHSININVRDDSNGDTALMLAAKSNNAKVVEALVERGADVTILNEEGKSALDLSSNHLKLAVLGKYSKNGDAKHGDGVSIIKAAWQGDADSLKKLLVSNTRSKSRGSSLLSKTNHKSDEGLSPLLVATRDVNIFIRLQRSIKLTYEPVRVIQELLRSKADVNAMDLEGHTALHFATRITTQQICREIVDLLLMYRPLLNNLDRTNLAPLHTATSNDNVPVVTALMEAGADPNLHGIGGATALHIGAQQDNEEMVRRLVSAGADINALDSAGMTPLCVARTSKMREFMRSLFMKMVSENGGVPVKLIYDELSNKRTIQKMIEIVPSSPVIGHRVALIDVNDMPPLDLKPLQMKMVQETQENLYDYNKNQRVPRPPILERSRRQSIGLSSIKRDKKTVEILPRIRQQSPILLLSKGQRPTQDRTLTRFQREQHPGVFLAERQAKRKTPTKPQPCMTDRKPPIPKHTCGFTEPTVVPKSRQGSAKSQCKRVPSRSSNNSGGEAGADQWLPGCPIINDGSDGGGTISRPTSATTSASNSFKGPKIHLKHVLKNILSTIDGTYTDDLISRYLSQQRPVKVKEMGFVDFLLQDCNPDYFSDVSCNTSIPSQHSHHADLSETSSSSVASGFSYQSITGLEEPKPEAPTLPLNTIMIGNTSTTDTHQVNLPFLRRPSIPQNFGLRVEIQDKNLINIKDLSSSENSSPDLKSKRPDAVAIKPSSLEQFVESNKQNVPVIVNLSPFASHPDQNLAPKNSSRSSRDSGFGSQATLLSDKRSPVKSDDSGIFAKSQNNKSDESLDTNEDERPVSSVSLGSDMSSDSSIEEKIEPVISVEIKSEEEQKEEPVEKEEEKKEIKPEAPVVGIRRNGRESAASIGLLTGMQIKSGPKLLSSRQNNSKVKETPFKRKVYNRKLPGIVEALTEETKTRDGKTLREKNLLSSARLRRQGKSAKGSQSSNSSTKSDKSDPKATRPGTVPSKPDHLSVTVSPSTKNPRPKTSAGISLLSPADDSLDPKKDALLTKISTITDIDALMYSMPLQIDSDSENTVTPRGNTDMSPKGGFNDNKSMYSERRSILTDFTGTTKIESIMGDTTQWKKGRLLGTGASGKVWHGVTADKMEVAVKQIELCGDIEDARDEYMKLQEEVRLLKCLKHDNIIRYYGTCLQDSNVNIFMEMVTGGSVSGRLKKEGPFPERLIQNLSYQLLDALRYIHAKNIVHRDIKGQNVLITENDKIKLIDFGCSKRLRRSLKNADALKTFRGTPYWMSPEVIKECGHGTKSDIWSLGCTVYEMLTGNPPWHSLPTMAAMYKIGSGNAVPHYPSNASDYCIDFMKACFIGDPKQRPTAEELMEYEFISLYSNRIKAQS